MKVKKLNMAAVTLISVLFAGSSFATKSDMTKSKNDAKAFVVQAVDYIKTHGEEEAIKEFNKTDGGFNLTNNYIFVLDFQGNTLANPSDLSMVGKNNFDLKDIKGRSIARALIEKAKYGGGYVSYYWKNPGSQQVECKTTYVMPYDKKLVVGTGFYHGSQKADCHKIS